LEADMGIDCDVRVGDEYENLDRWYVFDEVIKSKEPMTKSEALEKIRKLLNKRNLIECTRLWGDRRKEFRRYHKHWLLVAKKAIKKAKPGEKIVFYNEHDLPQHFWDCLERKQRET